MFSSSGTPVPSLCLERQIPDRNDGKAQGCRDTMVRKEEVRKMDSDNIPPLGLDLLGSSSPRYVRYNRGKGFLCPSHTNVWV